MTRTVQYSGVKAMRWMSNTVTLFVGVAFMLTSTSAPAETNKRLVDLTHPFDEQTIYWPTEDGFKLIKEAAGFTEQGYYYAANRFMCAEHGGTHIDAPVHFFEKGKPVDQIPLARLLGPGACVDVSQKCSADRDYQVAVDDFEKWEADNKASLEDRIVLIRTGFGGRWPDRAKYLGTAEHGKAAVAKLHFPGLDPSAADWLIKRRHIRVVGIDTASIDHGQTDAYPTHQRLFRDGVPALENVAAMDHLPANNFTVIALPMKIKGGSGAPCRVIAEIVQ
jgi:kynurenine formamidase